jgi:hypothetical protein
MHKKMVGILVVTLLIVCFVVPAMGNHEEKLYKGKKESFVFQDFKISQDAHYNIVQNDKKDQSFREVVRTQDNLAPNPSFEEGNVLPTGWEHTDFGKGEVYHWDSNYAYSGEKSIGISVPTLFGWMFKWYTTDLIPVDMVNNYYVLSCKFKYTDVPEHLPWQQILMPQIELYDQNEEYITYIVSVANYRDTLDWCFAAVYTESATNIEHPEEIAFARLGFIHRPQEGSSFDIEIRVDDAFFGIIEKNHPPEKPTINGPNKGQPGKEYTYTAVASDPDNDMIYYIWDWGNGNTSSSILQDSGTVSSVNYTWEYEGTYEVRVKARDYKKVESEWSDPIEVSIPKNKPINTPFLDFLENHPYLIPLLRKLLGF